MTTIQEVVYKSRTRQYAEQEISRREAARISALENDLEQAQRTILRLNGELLKETTERMRLEKLHDQMSEELDDKTEELEDVEGKLNVIGVPKRIVRKRIPNPAAVEAPVPTINLSTNAPKRSSRVRGGVK